jgi:molecular chaperone DnaJ
VRPRHVREDPYAVLGLEPGASRAEIRRAYRRRAMVVHPDVAGTAATPEMARLNRAREDLDARSASEVAADEAHPGRGSRGAPSTASGTEAEPPAWTEALRETWPDYWSAWNELPRRDRG